MPAENPPKYIYKIVPEAPPEPLPAVYPLSSLDAADGFIHLSEASQVREAHANCNLQIKKSMLTGQQDRWNMRALL